MDIAATVAPRRHRAPGVALRRLLEHVALALSVFVVVSPAILVLLWMVSLSLKTEVENTSYPPVFIPATPTLNNFAAALASSPFLQYTVNSVVVSGIATLAAIAVGVPAGYGIAKAKAHGLVVLVLISRMTPALSFLIPLFMLFRFVGLTGSLWSLVITHLVITAPIVVWIMIGFFEDLHPELEEAALVDGCNLWQAFLRIALPLSRPGVVVAAILAFIFSWNNFIFGAVLAGRETRTLPVAVYNVLSFEQVAWGPLAAAAILVTLPVLVLTVIFQRHIVTGLASGGVKGG